MNLDIDKFQDITEVLPILGALKWGFFPFGASQFCKNLGLNSLFFNNSGAHFSVGKII